MVATTDWAGIAAVVAALGSAVAAVVAAVMAGRLKAPVQETRGNVADIAAWANPDTPSTKVGP